jgi:hypothetical protein
LILGETGTGKGVLARWLHENSPRAEEAFVDLNCAGLSRELLETELFGHEKGAFTSAIASKQGLFEVAHRGTIFLDEVGDVDLQIQPKLLKVLEEKRFRRVGDVRDRQVDVRLISIFASARSRFRFLPCAKESKTSRRWPNTSSTRSPSIWAVANYDSTTAASRHFRLTHGRVTSANYVT